ncbi:MAG: BrnT family toxin [Deltaproteobacteria bacterium]|jgi:uncharacterized DUF497 family protein|nr:BrnT family toxin [Deltaproteobacteria bacterium]
MAYDSSGVRFEWDEAKNVANQRKHGVSFEEACELFGEGNEYLEVFDQEHSDDEDRFVCIGPIERGIVLVVKTEPAEDSIRIVSARFATKRESSMYTDFLRGLDE